MVSLTRWLKIIIRALNQLPASSKLGKRKRVEGHDDSQVLSAVSASQPMSKHSMSKDLAPKLSVPGVPASEGSTAEVPVSKDTVSAGFMSEASGSTSSRARKRQKIHHAVSGHASEESPGLRRSVPESGDIVSAKGPVREDGVSAGSASGGSTSLGIASKDSETTSHKAPTQQEAGQKATSGKFLFHRFCGLFFCCSSGRGIWIVGPLKALKSREVEHFIC